MAIVYLDVDDEITSAAARIRWTEDLELAIVLPAGSRIATSRINFRLLAREASDRSRRLAIVAPEASTRALAASAGLPVFATVMEYEESRREAEDEEAAAEAPAAPERPTGARPPGATPTPAGAQATPAGVKPAGKGAARGSGRGASAPGVPGRAAAPASTAPLWPDEPAPGTTAAPGGRAGAGDRTAGGERRPPAREEGRTRGAIGPSTGLGMGAAAAGRGRRRWPLVVAALLVVAILGGAGAAVGYVLLPTATVTLRLAAEPVGPITFTATADPNALAVDPATATIPAVRIAIPLSAGGTFKATGKRVEEAAATGTVRWDNCDPSRAYTIPSGTVVRTAAGVAFATREAILVPVAILTGTPPEVSVKCQSRQVDVTATRPGPDGNVEAGAIRVVPGDYDPNLVRVRNPAATGGGKHEEFPLVAKKDVDGAVTALTKQLDAQLAELAVAPPGAPAGATVFPETARRGEPTPSEPTADIVGREAKTFDLSLAADATVVAADPSALETLAADRIGARVPEGRTLREGSTRVTVGAGSVAGETVVYTVTASAEAVRDVSVDEVRALVKGRTAAAAEGLLAPYGSAEIVLWPDWASSVTSLDMRLTVTVEGVPPAEPTPPPTASPTPPPAASPSDSSGVSPAATAAP